ncbi:MAG: hypothetical protein ACTH2Q_01665 [Propionibacteriaceae bacterium]
MNEILLIATAALSLGVALAALWCVWKDRLPGWYLVGALGALEVVLIAVAVTGFIQLGLTERPVHGPTLVGYLVAVLLFAPAATVWAFIERSRFGTLVITLATVVIPVLLLRAWQVWTAA